MMLFPADLRTKNVIHYVISHTSPEKLGATKLNKVMWRADVAHYRRHGTTITGQSSYIRMPQGPVPNMARESLDELKREGKILERPVDTFAGTRREFVWVERAGSDLFTSEQVEILLEAIGTVCGMTASAASSETHDALWEEIENGAQIPIGAASVMPVSLEPGDIEWALEYADRI